MTTNKAKAEEINLVLSEPNVDLWRLRELALTEGGLVNDTLRKQAWPKLVGLGLPPSSSIPSTRISRTATNRSKLPPSSSLSSSTSAPPTSTTTSTTKSSTTTTTISNEGFSGGSFRIRTAKNVEAFESLDAEQIERDVSRCTWHLLTGSQRSRRLQMKHKHKKKVSALLKKKQVRLGNLINLTLSRSYRERNNDITNDNGPDDQRLCYFQGYHDIASICLSALGGASIKTRSLSSSKHVSNSDTLATSMGLDLPSRVLIQISQSHFRDAMRQNFVQLQSALKLIVFPLIAVFDPQVHDQLYACDMEPYFCLSWVITWFSHDVRDTKEVKRLFDVFLVSHPLLCVYMSVAMVLHSTNRNQVLCADYGDFACVHQALAHLPKNSSSAGWKSVGDGYMSGDDDDGDDNGTLTTDDMDQSCLSGEDAQSYMISDEMSVMSEHNSYQPNNNDGAGNHETENMLFNTNMVDNRGKVGFQELIDLAIGYMRRIPPRNLVHLARRYHLSDESLLAKSSSIALLQPPPKWGMIASAPADWVLKQRIRESLGKSSTSRKDRRTRTATNSMRARSSSRTRRAITADNTTDATNQHKGGREGYDVEDTTDIGTGPGSTSATPTNNTDNFVEDAGNKEEEIQRYLIEQKKSLAVIAAGFGPAGDEERRIRKRKRKMLMRGTVVSVAILAIVVGVAQTYGWGKTTTAGDSAPNTSSNGGNNNGAARGDNSNVKMSTSRRTNANESEKSPAFTSATRKESVKYEVPASNSQQINGGEIDIQMAATTVQRRGDQQCGEKVEQPAKQQNAGIASGLSSATTTNASKDEPSSMVTGILKSITTMTVKTQSAEIAHGLSSSSTSTTAVAKALKGGVGGLMSHVWHKLNLQSFVDYVKHYFSGGTENEPSVAILHLHAAGDAVQNVGKVARSIFQIARAALKNTEEQSLI